MTDVTLLASGFRTVEGPTITADGSLYFGDVRGGGLHRLLPSGAIETVVPKRRGIGGVCPHVVGGVVMSGRDLTHYVDGLSRVILSREDVSALYGTSDDGAAIGGFNDIGADPAGRIFAGVQRIGPEGEYGPGLLVMVTGEHVAEVVYRGLLPNGNAVSLDERVLYQVDSAGRRVLIIDLTAELPRVIGEMATDALPGMPDGMAVDEDGQLWIAFHHGGCVARFDPTGRLTRRIDFPTPMITSLCFGPPGSHDLYVVTGGEDDSTEPQGSIYRLDAGVAGGPVFAART